MLFGVYVEDVIIDYLLECVNFMFCYKKLYDVLFVNYYGDFLMIRGIRYCLLKIISKVLLIWKIYLYMLCYMFVIDLFNNGVDMWMV